jgi:hypothetical protein
MKWKLSGLVLLLSLLGFMLWPYFGSTDKGAGTNETLTQKEIDKGTVAKVTIDSRKKRITQSRVIKAPAKGVGAGTSGQGDEVRTTTERFERRAVITEDVEGNLHIWAPKSGAVLEAGVLVGARRDGVCLGLDGQLLYYKAWGLNVGVNALLRGRMLPRAYVGVSYSLPWEAFSNTSVLVGIDTSKEAVIGIRVRL